MIVLVDEITMPIWLTIIISLSSGILCTIATLVVQHCSEKNRVKRELFLKLVSLRDCTFSNEEFRSTMNKVQIVFYNHSKVVAEYEKFVKAIADNTYSANQTIIIDEFIAMLESMAVVVGYKEFDWQNIKNKYTTPDLYNSDIEEAKSTTNSSTGVKKRKTRNKNDDLAPENKGGK